LDFKGLLRLRIHELELSQKAFAEKAGVDEASLSRFLSGERDVKSSTLFKICTALELRIEDMFVERSAYLQATAPRKDWSHDLLRLLDDLSMPELRTTLRTIIQTHKEAVGVGRRSIESRQRLSKVVTTLSGVRKIS
jgi:transcriptional regulator with XRE-family HTH domain